MAILRKVEKAFKNARYFLDVPSEMSRTKEEVARISSVLKARSQREIDQRLWEKKVSRQAVNVVFVCHRPAVWESLRSVYDALRADKTFNVVVVAIPNKKQLPGKDLLHGCYCSEGAEDYWESYGCVRGYDYDTGEWLDLESLKPDYIFFQQPYNITRPDRYHSSIVSAYAKIVYVAYYPALVFDDVHDECTPLDYLADLSFFFTQTPDDDSYIRGRYAQVEGHHCKIEETGYPRFDYIYEYMGGKCAIWNDSKSFKVVWTPRWTTNEGNCHFFEYRDLFMSYCDANPGVELAFRPHPQAFAEWSATGEMSLDEQKAFRTELECTNMHIDESDDYRSLLFSSNCLVTDRSTILIDYFFTLNPIIYCASNGVHDTVIERYARGMYVVESWDELVVVLENIRNGIDPLFEERVGIVTDYLLPANGTAGSKIKDILKADALK